MKRKLIKYERVVLPLFEEDFIIRKKQHRIEYHPQISPNIDNTIPVQLKNVHQS
jgi:hypothetical protein